MKSSLFAHVSYKQVVASGPPSPPLGFPAPTVHRAEVVKVVRVARISTGETSSVEVLRRVDAEGHNQDRAYELPGTLVRDTLCGRIVQCEVLQQKKLRDSVVYETIGEQVAIKIDQRQEMRHLHHGTQVLSENPWKEVAALEMLGKSCANVVSLLDALVDDKNLYEIMPYYCGGSLHELLSHYPQGLSEEQSRYFFGQIIQAIYHMHSRGVCHRDISTHNIMLDEQHKHCVLIDFGMCVRVPHSYPDDDTTEDVTDITVGTIRRIIHCQHHCGKLRFMAPEMYRMENFDGLTVDLWSAAVVLFIMLTGREPYEKPDIKNSGFYDLMDERFYWDPKGVAQVFSWGHSVSDDAVDLLKRMFRINPQDRLSIDEIMQHPWTCNKRSV